jgi:hypothetical protein
VKKTIAAGFLLSLGFLAAAEPPQTAISNGVVRARGYPPDAENGYYRGTFDWSGVISILEYKGHSYFGQWFPRYDPRLPPADYRPVAPLLNDAEGIDLANAAGARRGVR